MSIKSNLDQFYTSPVIVNKFLEIIKKYKFITEKTIIIEPSAGDGKFIDGFIKQFPNNKIKAFDIEKNHPKVKQQDFLDTKLKYSKNNIVIGNPPFGNRSKLAINFINHASKFSDVICFVLPIQFRRWNVQKQINKEFKLIYSSNDLPKNSFLLNNKPYNVNCCLQIWIRDEKNKYKNLRILQAPENKHEDFKLFIHNNTKETLKYFDKTKYKWDFAVHRQGYYNYNERIENPNLLIPNRQYLFIKIINPKAKKIFEKINFELLSNSNTTIKGFSNTDLISEYKKIKHDLFNV